MGDLSSEQNKSGDFPDPYHSQGYRRTQLTGILEIVVIACGISDTVLPQAKVEAMTYLAQSNFGPVPPMEWTWK